MKKTNNWEKRFNKAMHFDPQKADLELLYADRKIKDFIRSEVNRVLDQLEMERHPHDDRMPSPFSEKLFNEVYSNNRNVEGYNQAVDEFNQKIKKLREEYK